MTMNHDFFAFCQRYRTRVERNLARVLAKLSSSWLQEAMRYSTMNGGKRFRALLVYACGQAVSTDLDDILFDRAACAIELIHAYSLIHDDLPAMDNSHLRRGKPTCHMAFDEATAILAGDALQALAFETLCDIAHVPQKTMIDMIKLLANACGTSGMAGGQSLDLKGLRSMSAVDLIELYRLKTGVLIECSALMGIMSAQCQDVQLVAAIKKYSQHLGLAFQIKDDLLDDSDELVLGKSSGLDQVNQKLTLVTLLGVDEAKKMLNEEYQSALSALSSVAMTNSRLTDIAKFVVERQF